MASYIKNPSTAGSSNLSYKGTHPSNSNHVGKGNRIKEVKSQLASRNDAGRQRDTGPLMSAVSRARRGPFAGTGTTIKGMTGNRVQITGGHKAGHITPNSKPDNKIDLIKATTTSKYNVKIPKYNPTFGTRTAEKAASKAAHLMNGLSPQHSKTSHLNPNSKDIKLGGNGENKGAVLQRSGKSIELPGGGRSGAGPKQQWSSSVGTSKGASGKGA